jgi:hypothetical protein
MRRSQRAIKGGTATNIRSFWFIRRLQNFCYIITLANVIVLETNQAMLKARAASVTQIFLFAVIFAALQIVAVSHNTAYGDIGHTHDGTSCIFPVTSDSAQDTTTTAGNSLSETVFPIRYTHPQILPPDLRKKSANRIRGPPSSQS